MYLDYQTYQTMGGDLDNSAFTKYNRKAEYLIKSQAGGKTGLRIGQLSELPQAVIDCTFDLISHLATVPTNVASESQSLGGQSESKSYLSKENLDEETLEILHIYLYPIKLDGYSILYKGDIPWDIEHHVDEYALLLDNLSKVGEEATEAAETAKEATGKATEAVAQAEKAVDNANNAVIRADNAAEKAEKAIEDLTANAKRYANAISNTVFGKDVIINDISPILTELNIKVSRNAIPANYDIPDDFSYLDGSVTGAVRDGQIIFDINQRTNKVLYVKICSVSLTNGNYFFSGCPAGGAFTSYYGLLRRLGFEQFNLINENGINITVTSNGTYELFFVLNLTNLEPQRVIFSPVLTKEGGEDEVACVEYDGEGRLETTVFPEEDGTVKGIVGIYPITRITTNNDNYFVSVKYNRDLVKVIEELQQAIISLGGDV